MSNVNQLNTAKSSLSESEIKAFLTENLREFRRYAYSLTNNTHDADDLLHTVFERVLTKSMPSDVNPKAWVYRICKNAWIDELRHRKLRQVPDGIDAFDIEDTDVDAEPACQIHKYELAKAIEELAPPHRAVISLVVIAGLSYSEVAESLEIPIGTVMSRVARARQQLIERLAINDSE